MCACILVCLHIMLPLEVHSMHSVTHSASEQHLERTAGNVQLRDLGSKGFMNAGDELCWVVQVSPGVK
jgi:hypothetical protein